MTTYHHLSPEERAFIMLECQHGSSIRSIALRLHRSPSTVSRELHRNQTTKGSYCATGAANAYHSRRKQSVRPKKLVHNTSLCDIVESHLIQHKWSPEQISETLKNQFPGQTSMQVSPETIYAHIYAYPKGELRKLIVQSLRRAKSKRGPRGSKNSCYSSLKVENDQLFANRPESVNSREIAGHWEGDLIVGAMYKSCVGTIVERKTGYLLLSKMQSKTAQHVREGF